MPSFFLEESGKLAEYLTKTLNQVMRRAALAAGWRVVGAIQNEVIPAEDPQPVDRGFYRAGWKAEPTDAGADVYNTMPYAGVIDRGARAENIKVGRAMIRALAEWALRKGLVKPAGPGREARASAEQQAERMAWAVATAMKTRGIFNRDGEQGLHVADKATRYVQGYMVEEVKRELKRALG